MCVFFDGETSSLKFDVEIGLAKRILAGLISGGIGASIANPTDLVMVRLICIEYQQYLQRFGKMASQLFSLSLDSVSGCSKATLPKYTGSLFQYISS